MCSILIYDVLEELKEENNRLLNELKFANKCLNKLIELKLNLVLHSNKIKTTLEPNDWNIIEEIIKDFDEMVDKREITTPKIHNSVQLKSIRKFGNYRGFVDQTTEPEDSEMLSNEEIFNNNLSIKELIESEEETEEDMPSDDDYDPNDDKPMRSALRSIKCYFADCGKKFVSDGGLKNHIQYCHSTEEAFVCHQLNCDFRTTNKRFLNDHMKAKHSDKRVISCTIEGCVSSFKCKSSLEQHMKRAHSQKEREKFICEFCHKEYPNKTSLSRHRSIQHINSKNIECTHPDCDYIAINEKALDIHMIKHSDERLFVCDVDGCDRRYKTEANLNKHKNSHSMTRNELTCCFDGCDKTFKSKIGLNEHIISIHVRDKELHCEWPGCDYKTYRLNTQIQKLIP